MNHCVLDWSVEDESRSFHDLLSSANHKRSWPENELVELLWQNGHVVMHSQTNRMTMAPPNETKQCQKLESASRNGEPWRNSANMAQEEMTSWLQYPVDDPLEKEFSSDFIYGLQTSEPSATDKLKVVISEVDKFAEHGAPEENSILSESVFEQSDILQFGENMMPVESQVVTTFPQSTCAENGGCKNFAHFSKPLRADAGPLSQHCGEKNLGNQIQGEIGESSSMTTKESSICGSNQVQNRFTVSCSNTMTVVPAQVVKEDTQTWLNHERVHTDMHETTVTSSSGGSGCTIGRKGEKSTSTRIHKRRGRDADESEFHSEEAEYESIETSKKAQKSASARRKRAAEVHNLSERRRRDRINEKMRALQELIPHCNKSDKASMLDDAIEYLKSLQLQVMWMGSGMAPMMFPGVHHYMPQILSMGPGSMPSLHGPIPFPRVPLIKQSVSSYPAVKQAGYCPPSGISPANFQNQMQNPQMLSSFAHCLGLHRMQPLPQMTNLYSFGSQLMQQNPTALAASSSAPCDGGAPSENTKNGSAG